MAPEEQARRYAFLLLKYRPRSEEEMRFRLRAKVFSETVIEDTISFLKDKKFLDDRLFAKAWVNSRVSSGMGSNRIIRELKLKGIAKPVITDCIENKQREFPEEKAIIEIAEERLKKLRGIEPLKAKFRLYGFLVRRGFPVPLVLDVINRFIKIKTEPDVRFQRNTTNDGG